LARLLLKIEALLLVGLLHGRAYAATGLDKSRDLSTYTPPPLKKTVVFLELKI